MSAISRVRASAFTRRRKLNDESAATTSESDVSNSASSAKRLKLNGAASTQKESRVIKQQRPANVDASHKDSGDELDENSFGPLVDAKVVSFIGTREIDQSEDGICKVRLSKAQKCSVQGIAKLWVREGTVCIDGAVLNEGIEAYTIFCATSGLCTEVYAQSKFAEIQLETVRSTEDLLPLLVNVPGKLGETARRGKPSFSVLDQDQTDLSSRQLVTSDINRQIQALVNKTSSTTDKDGPETRILFCGKRSADTYRAAIVTMNTMLTSNAGRSSVGNTRRVLFLDLDYLAPAFSGPGTITISTHSSVVLGPSYSQPLGHIFERPNHILASHYISAVETMEKPKLDLRYIQTLLDPLKDVVITSCMIVRVGSWFANTTSTEKASLRKLLSADLAVCIDSVKSSPLYEAARTMLVDAPDTFVQVLIPPSTTSSVQEHKLLLQSHFRADTFIDDTALWYRDPIPNVQSRKLFFSADSSTTPLSFLQVHGGVLRPQDIPRALQDNLVVLVAAQHTNDLNQPITTRTLFPVGPEHDSSNQLSSPLTLRDKKSGDILHYIALAYVEAIDHNNRSLTLNTQATKDRLQHHIALGHELGLVLEKPGADGRFSRQLLF